MIVASINSQSQQTWADMLAHPQGTPVVSEPHMLNVHPLPQQPGAVDISVVPYESFMQHPFSQSSNQPVTPNTCLPSHHIPNPDTVLIPSNQHLIQPSSAMIHPSYMQQQQPMPHTLPQSSPVQSQEGIVLPAYQQLPQNHDLVLSPHHHYSGQPHGTVILTPQQNSYQHHDPLASQQYIAPSHVPPLPGVLLSPIHQSPHPLHDNVLHSSHPIHDNVLHSSHPIHDNVLHSSHPIHDNVLHSSHPQPSYAAMHGTLVSPTQPHSGILQTPPVLASHPLPSVQMTGAAPVAHHYPPVQPFNSVLHPQQQHTQIHSNIIANAHQPTSLLHTAVVPTTPSQNPNTISDAVVPPTAQHAMQNSMLQHTPMQGALVATHQQQQHPHHPQQQQHSPLHRTGCLPVHNQHPTVVPHQPVCSMSTIGVTGSHNPSNSLYSTVNQSPQQHSMKMLNKHIAPHATSLPMQPLPKSNEAVVSRQLLPKLNEPVLKYDASTHPSHQSATSPSKPSTSSGTTNSTASETNRQNSSHHVVPIKKLGTLALKPNGFNDSRAPLKVGHRINKEASPPFNLVPSSLTSKPVFSKTNCPINCKTNDCLKPLQKTVAETTKSSSPNEKLSDILNTSQPASTDMATKSTPMSAATSSSAVKPTGGAVVAGCQQASSTNIETLHKSAPVCDNFDVNASPVISNGNLIWEKDSAVISQLSSFFKNCQLQDNYSQGSVCPSQQIRTDLYPPKYNNKSYSLAYQTPISESSPTTQRDRLHLTLFLH